MFQHALVHIVSGLATFKSVSKLFLLLKYLYKCVMVLCWTYSHRNNLHTLQGGSRGDVMIYLLFYDNWHVTQHNRTMNTQIMDTSANHWCLHPPPGAPLPQPAGPQLALPTTFGTERMQGEIKAKYQALLSVWCHKWRWFDCKWIYRTVNGVCCWWDGVDG